MDSKENIKRKVKKKWKKKKRKIYKNDSPPLLPSIV